MAISNRDRVGRGFELLAIGLGPFVDHAMGAAAPSGQDWLALLEARENTKQGGAKKFSKTDPQLLLKVLTEDWRVFNDRLSRAEQAMATELRDARNRWAHNESFNSGTPRVFVDRFAACARCRDGPRVEVRSLMG